MRVLFVVGALAVGGGERHTVDLALALVARGHVCRIVSVKPAEKGGLNVPAAQGLDVTYCDAAGYLDRDALRSLAVMEADFCPDLIVGVNQYALMYVHLARLFKGAVAAPIAAVFHTTELRTRKDHWLNVIYKRFFARSALLVFVCDYQSRYWQQRGLAARRNLVIHNGIDAGRYSPAKDAVRAAVRKQHGFAEGDFVIGITAALRPEKNHAFLIQALRRLREQGVPAKLLMLGNGPLRADLEARVTELGLGAHAVFAGAHADVRPFIAAFDVMTLASTHIETFSLAVLEAMSMGIPAVISDIGGAREMVFPGVNGFVYPANDMEGYLEALGILLDGGRRHTMGVEARRVVLENFTGDVMVEHYRKAFAEVTGT